MNEKITNDERSKPLLRNYSDHFKKNVPEFIPLLGLIGVMAFFALATNGLSLSAFNLKILLNQVVVLAVIASGSTLIFTMGAFDISLGSVTCLTSVVGVLAINITGSPAIMLIVCIICAISISLLNGACIVFFKLPSFIVTLATMNIITAAVSLILGTTSMITIDSDIAYLDTVYVKVAALLIIIAIAGFMFNFNKLGRSNKIIGGSQIVAAQSGISIIKNTMLTFLISGIGIGLGSFLLLARTSSVSVSTGSSLAFDIIIAIVLGGMPVSGGARSKITAAIIGAFTITALNNGLVILGGSTGILQVVRGILFLTVVGLLMLKHRSKLLPR